MFASRSLLLSSVSMLALVVGCHHERPSSAPVTTTTTSETTTTSAVMPASSNAMVNASPGLNVSSEIMKQCNLSLSAAGTPQTAPQFGFDETTLSIGDYQLLSQIGSCLSTGPLAGRHVELTGRTDNQGTSEYNMSLGARRASAVADKLQGFGVKNDQLGQTSRGELDAQGSDPAGQQVDRRVDITLAQ